METKLVNADDDDVNGPPAAAAPDSASSSSRDDALTVREGDSSNHALCSSATRAKADPLLLIASFQPSISTLDRSSEKKLSKDRLITSRHSVSTSTVEPYVKPYAYIRQRAKANTERKLSQTAVRIDLHKIGIYGWRKRFLYFIILVLAGLIAINAALIYYLFVMLQVSISDGTIGSILMKQAGMEILRKTTIHDELVAGIIRSRSDRLHIASQFENVSITDGKSNKLTISPECVEVRANAFRVLDTSNRLVFSLENGKISVAQDRLAIKNDYGFYLRKALQTPSVHADPRETLQIVSPTRSIRILGPNGVSLRSRAGPAFLMSLQDLNLESRHGKIALDSSDIRFKNLKKISPSSSAASLPSSMQRTQFPKSSGEGISSENASQDEAIGQLCVCSNGRLFLAAASESCFAPALDACS